VLPARLRLALAVLVACSLAAVGGVWLASGSESPAPAVGASGFAGSLRPPGLKAPSVEGLRDADGRRVDAGALRGTPVVYTFVYSTCEDTCPTQVQSIRGALDDLGRDVPVIAVSVDPRGDTPTRARRFVAAQGMTGRMRFLLGSRSELEPVWKGFAIRPQEDELEHSAYVVLVDERGRQRVGWPGSQLVPEGLEHDLRVLLEA
jgi:protein SCO1/2